MTYLQKFEENILNDEKTFLMFMTVYPHRVKHYLQQLQNELGRKEYLDSHQVRKIWSFYTKTVNDKGLIDEKYIKESLLANEYSMNKSNRDVYHDLVSNFVFDLFEVSYFATNYNVFERQDQNKSWNILKEKWLNTLFNDDKNIISFPVAPIFQGNIISVGYFDCLIEEFNFDVPKHMSLSEYFEINQGFLNHLHEEKIKLGLKKYFEESDAALYEMSSFISMYSDPYGFKAKNHMFAGKIITVFYKILCEENGLDYLLSLETILDDGENKEDENLQTLYQLFSSKLTTNVLHDYCYNSMSENLIKIFFRMNQDPSFENYSYILMNMDERIFIDIIKYLTKNPSQKFLITSMFINNLNFSQLKSIMNLKDQIEFLDVEDSVLFWMEKEDSFAYRENIFNEDNFRNLLVDDSFALFIVIFGLDFLMYNDKTKDLFKYLNKNIENIFIVVNENDKQHYELKSDAINLLIDFQKGIE